MLLYVNATMTVKRRCRRLAQLTLTVGTVMQEDFSAPSLELASLNNGMDCLEDDATTKTTAWDEHVLITFD